MKNLLILLTILSTTIPAYSEDGINNPSTARHITKCNQEFTIDNDYFQKKLSALNFDLNVAKRNGNSLAKLNNLYNQREDILTELSELHIARLNCLSGSN